MWQVDSIEFTCLEKWLRSVQCVSFSPNSVENDGFWWNRNAEFDIDKDALSKKFKDI